MLEYYILFTCDEWKAYTSFRLMGLFASISDLKNALIELENKGEISWSSVEDFNDCWDIEELQEIIEHIYIEEVEPNHLV